jgi:hypothetical protein
MSRRKREWMRVDKGIPLGYGGCSPLRDSALWIYLHILRAFLTNMNFIQYLSELWSWRIFCSVVDMMTRRDVLDQLKRVGIKDLSLLKRSCRDFENYMAVNYDYEILRKEKPVKLRAPSIHKPVTTPMKISLNLRQRRISYPRLGFSASKG